MTKQESFKNRIRVRMETTGERYATARRSLIERSAKRTGRAWVSEPEVQDDKLREMTGRGWNEWCDLIEASLSPAEGHTAIASELRERHEVDSWWAQTITVGYERITGIRLPHQQPDGTFTANKSKTMEIDGDELRRWLLDAETRTVLFPGHTTVLRSKPQSKSVRFSMGPGVALVTMDPGGPGRVKITVNHEKLPSFEDVAEWKFYWADWLEAVANR